MTRLILWRHGRTEWNAIGRVQGQTDIPLDEVGITQAAQTAPRLADFKPALIVASDLRRASATAAALAAITGQVVEYDNRLRERDFGPWQGLTQVDIRAAYPEDFAVWGTTEQFTDARIETLDDMIKRVGSALRDIAERIGDDTAVVVTHGGAARAGCGAMLGWPMALLQTLGGLGNCRYTDLWRHPTRGWQLHGHNV